VEVILLPAAEEDPWSAWEYYEQIQPGLGDAFEDELRRALAQIATFPESAPVYSGQFRRLLVRRFEHGSFFRVHGQRIVITAIWACDNNQPKRSSAD
jgi:plasmid stabilization system protein ParE